MRGERPSDEHEQQARGGEQLRHFLLLLDEADLRAEALVDRREVSAVGASKKRPPVISATVASVSGSGGTGSDSVMPNRFGTCTTPSSVPSAIV